MDNYIQAQTKHFHYWFSSIDLFNIFRCSPSQQSPREVQLTQVPHLPATVGEKALPLHTHIPRVLPRPQHLLPQHSRWHRWTSSKWSHCRKWVSLEFLSLRKLCMLCCLFPVLISTVWLIIFVNTVYIAVFSTRYQSSNSMGTVLQSTFTSPSSETSWVCSISTETSRLLKGVLVHHLVRKQQDDTGWLSLGLC